MARSAGNEKAKRSGLFDDLSMAQVTAGALAAVTSMLLASQIGIYGSVIGVAVGSIVSAVASQLYKKFLMSSAEKLSVLMPGETEEGHSESASGGTDPNKTVVMKALPGTEKSDVAGQTVPIANMAVRRSTTPSVSDDALQDDITVQRVRSIRARKKKTQRKVLAVSVVSAVLALLVSASVIELVTQGQGFGAKDEPVIAQDAQPQPQTPNTEGVPLGGGNGSPATDNSSGDTAKDQAGESGSQDSTNSGSTGSKDEEQESGSKPSTGGEKPDTTQPESGSSGSGDAGAGSGSEGSPGSGGSSGSGGPSSSGGSSGSSSPDTNGDSSASNTATTK